MSIDVSKVRYISLIRIEGGESLVNIPYEELTLDPDLIAGFVSAVIIFAKTPIRTIRKAAYDILIEVGETSLLLLVVDPIPDETPYRSRMKRILDLVEEEHGTKLENFEGDVRRFREVALKILTEFPYSEPEPSLVPVRKSVGVPIPYRVGIIDHQLEKLESFINGKRTVSEILDLIGLDEDEATALISVLEKYGWIDYKRRLKESDYLVRSNCPQLSVERLKQQFGMPLDELLKQFDKPVKISEALDAVPFDRNACWFIVNKLLELGCLASPT
ncbi:MAG: hypothetical protein ACFFED_12390 [Candidatus Thorarchaeota archaeon]